ncbi:MAG: HNH endonuclease [Saprospiraceae bacterium]|nr:HNH endonuclease [Saprospiraceae bacterium]
MRERIPNIIKKLVANRAGNRCEYCRIPEALANFDFHIEHVVGIQHGVSSSPDNLAYCCSFCNWKKEPTWQHY